MMSQSQPNLLCDASSSTFLSPVLFLKKGGETGRDFTMPIWEGEKIYFCVQNPTILHSVHDKDAATFTKNNTLKKKKGRKIDDN